MKDARSQFNEFATTVAGICSHVSVREDEDGPYIFALGLKEVHTLQIRKLNELYVVQLWYGGSDEEEFIVAEPEFISAEEAFEDAVEWLGKDAA